MLSITKEEEEERKEAAGEGIKQKALLLATIHLGTSPHFLLWSFFFLFQFIDEDGQEMFTGGQ